MLLLRLLLSCSRWGPLSSDTHRLLSLGSVGLRAFGLEQLGRPGSAVVATRLQSTGPAVPRGMWGLPGSATEPLPPALGARSFTTEPPGKLRSWYFKLNREKWIDG